ncbi:hypothetical protein [Actinoplanes sp. NPDC051851]|uniref:hypothetical protein n=1 Tax=Actinoplanes sp. NPDC051851 TaxID=3154753 RepID=UPI0034309632
MNRTHGLLAVGIGLAAGAVLGAGAAQAAPAGGDAVARAQAPAYDFPTRAECKTVGASGQRAKLWKIYKCVPWDGAFVLTVDAQSATPPDKGTKGTKSTKSTKSTRSTRSTKSTRGGKPSTARPASSDDQRGGTRSVGQPTRANRPAASSGDPASTTPSRTEPAGTGMFDPFAGTGFPAFPAFPAFPGVPALPSIQSPASSPFGNGFPFGPATR